MGSQCCRGRRSLLRMGRFGRASRNGGTCWLSRVRGLSRLSRAGGFGWLRRLTRLRWLGWVGGFVRPIVRVKFDIHRRDVSLKSIFHHISRLLSPAITHPSIGYKKTEVARHIQLDPSTRKHCVMCASAFFVKARPAYMLSGGAFRRLFARSSTVSD